MHVQNAHAQSFVELAGLNPSTHYQVLETDHFKITFDQKLEKFTSIAAPLLEEAHQTLSPLLKWQPRNKISVLVIDNEDSANGFALPALRVGIVLMATPPEPWFNTAYSEDWIRLLVFHEYTHILNIDPTTSWMEGLRYWFGDIIRPNGLWTPWMLEGLASYAETVTTQQGRGRSSLWAALARTLVQSGRLQLSPSKNTDLSLDVVTGDYPYYPGGEIPYFFGYQLWNELFTSTQKGLELAGEYSLGSSSRVPYFLNGQLENLTQKNWDDIWDSWVKRIYDQAQSEIKQIETAEMTEHEPITNARYSALGGAISPNGEWLAWNETSLEKRNSLWLQRIKSGKKTRVTEKYLGVGISFTPRSDWVIYSSLTRQSTFLNYSELYAYEIATGKKIQLTFGMRAKDPHVSPDGTQIVFTQNTPTGNILTIANLIDQKNGVPSLKDIHALYSPDDFSILGSAKFLSDSKRVVFSSQKRGELYSDLLMVPTNGSPTLETLVHQFGFARYPHPYENKIYFSSDVTGVENIYEYDLGTKSHQPVTHVYTAAELPFTSPAGTLYASLLSAQGFEIVRFPKTNIGDFGTAQIQKTTYIPTLKTNPLFPKSLQRLTSLHSEALALPLENTKDYSPWSSLWPRQWAPIAEFSLSSYSGAHFFGNLLGFDTTGAHQYFVSLGYHTLPKTFDPYLQYTYYGFLPQINFSAQSKSTDIKTTGVLNSYSKTQELFLGLKYPLRWSSSSLNPELYTFYDWIRMRDLATGNPVASPPLSYLQGRASGVGARISFSNTESSKLGLWLESGVEARAATEMRFYESTPSIAKYLASFASYHEIFEHSVLKPKIRWAGTSRAQAFSSSTVFLEPGLHTTLDALGLRGYPQAGFRTRGTGIASLDFILPLAKIFSGISSIGTFPVFLEQLYLNTFSETAFIPSSRLGLVTLPSLGGGLNLNTTLFYRAPVTLSLTYEYGFKKTYGGEQVVGFNFQIPELW